METTARSNSSVNLGQRKWDKVLKRKLKHHAAALTTLVDGLIQECRESERSINSLRTCVESEKAQKELWQHLYKQHKREKEEAHKKILELEGKLDEKQKLELEIQEHKGKLEVMKPLGGDSSAGVQHKIDQLKEQLKQKVEDLDDLEAFNRVLLKIERERYVELQEAREELIAGSSDLLSSNPVGIGIKRMGLVDENPFKNACKTRFPPEEAEIKAAEVCSLWQETIKDSDWYRFQIIKDDKGNPQILLKEDDERLCGLKNEWGDKVYEAVTSALINLREYNHSGCYVVPEFWNFKENRKATLKEVIHCVFTQLKSRERKRK